MAFTSNGFLDNLLSGLLGPKGNLADWQHASRLYVNGNQKLAPKVKFLYHVYFELNPVVEGILPELKTKHNLEIGMLVKAAELPKFTAETHTKNKYNRKKVVQTSVRYEPINITFHDDNYGVTTALLEAYYRYYFADGGYGRVPGAYNKSGYGDNTYKGSGANQYKYGLDNAVTIPFFRSIKISQLAKKTFTTYTLVNPLVSNWQHDNLANNENGSMENRMTIQYEAVHYSRGTVETGANGEPTGFGAVEHYDTQPSPISLLGGGQLGLGGSFGAAADLYDYMSKGTGFSSPLEAGLGAFQLIRSLENLSSEGLREEGFNILKDSLGNVAGIDVSGVSNVVIPMSNGTGGDNVTTQATQVSSTTTQETVTSSQRTMYLENPVALEDAAINLYRTDYLNGGGNDGVNGANSSWETLPTGTKQLYRDKVLELV